VPPFGAAKIRAVKKERKHYHYDWTLLADPGKRYENFVALHLLKWVHYLEDSQGRNMELRYFRDIDGREVDFVVVEDARPVLFVECKLSADRPSRHLLYLKSRFPQVPGWQIHAEGTRDYQTPEGIRVAPAQVLLGGLI
jgi:hypothetical protein